MDKALFQRIVALLQPHFDDIPARKALLNNALFDSGVLPLIDWSGAAAIFTPRLVRTLYSFESATIIDVLKELKRQVGSSHHPEIDSIIQALAQLQPPSQRDIELVYLEGIREDYEHWLELYTDMAARAQIEQRKVKAKSAAARRYLQMRHNIHERIDHSLDADKGKVITTEDFSELREGIRKYKRVALIGDPGAGKTTTLQRLAFELAAEATEQENAPLPLFVRMGAYQGAAFEDFLQSNFGGLRLADYLPERIMLLLDGLNEMPAEHHENVKKWIQAHPDVAILVSCRKLDYVTLKLPLQRVDVAALDLERIRLFMSNFLEDDHAESLFWALAGYRAREAWGWYQTQNKQVNWRAFWFGEDEPGFYYEPQRKILDTLRQDLHEQQQLPDMLGTVTNPFLLQLVIDVYFTEGEAPRNKGDLFGHFVTMLFAERGRIAERSQSIWIDESLQREALAELAYRMQAEKRGTAVPVDWVKAVFHETIPDVDPEILLYCTASASILDYGATVRFTHQLLQEYFAATGMGADMRAGVSAQKYFPSANWWEVTGWEETAILLAGIEGDASEVVTWLTPVQPDLAYRVATESGVDCSDAAMQPLYIPPKDARSSPYARAEWGRKIADQDTRRGVGLLPNGLPDIDWVHIPAGEFKYGDENEDDNPPQTLELPDYYIARYPITFQQFQAFLDAEDGFDNPDWWDGMEQYKFQEMGSQHNPYGNHPRETVSWYQAVAFCRWLEARLNAANLKPDASLQIRLPLETEWEKAARSTDGREYPWGDGYRVGHANCDEQENGDGIYFLNQTTAVGLYELGVSPYGLYDMSGNVFEWCLNKHSNSEYYIIYESGGGRVLRGGSFLNGTYNSRCAFRLNRSPHYRDLNLGFRLVCAPILVRR